MNYKLTVIVPVYNQENLILRALYSIPNRKDIEVIIVNDGSTDNTHNKILEYINDNNLICTTNYCNLEINQGVSNAVNLGYEKAKGEYIVLLGSDDYFLPAIEVVIAHANGEDLVYFAIYEEKDGVKKLNKVCQATVTAGVAEGAITDFTQADGKTYSAKVFVWDEKTIFGREYSF